VYSLALRRGGMSGLGGWVDSVLLPVLLPVRLTRRRLAHAIIVQQRALQVNRMARRGDMGDEA
jgi:hypothetical protein